MGRRLPVRRTRIAARVLALSLAFMVVGYRPAFSNPGDIFSVSAPLITQQPQQSAPIASSDASVSTQTGALTYQFAVKTPPGRGKASPALSLSYSSQAPIFGGLAAGWTLSGVPMVSEDDSMGRLGSLWCAPVS